MSKTINLGDVVRDKITKFEGIATGYATMLHNCPRWSITPQVTKDGKPIDSRSFDEPDVEFVAASNVRGIPCQRPAEPVELGDVVRDTISGLEGRVQAVWTFLAGCVRVEVKPAELKDGLPVDSAFFDEVLLEVVTRANPRPAKVATGGPRAEPVR